MKKKRLIRWGIVLLVLFILAEGVCRYYGLNQQTLYREDKDFEYIAQPNQRNLIYRHKYVTNEFSMRSEPILPEDTVTALLMGDSILYGTTATDQDSLASTILEKMLQAKLKRRVRVLNISTPSWGPDNMAAYLKKYGTFHAKIIILVTSSADAHDNMTFEHVLGKGVYFEKNNFFAVQSLIQKCWYLLKIKMKPQESLALVISRESKEFNPGFGQLDSICASNHIQFFNYLHPMLTELNDKKYDSRGVEIVNFSKQNNIPLISGMDHEKEDGFLDGGHFSNKGQKYLANLLYPIVLNAFEK
jgi:hypothetical protein